MTDARTVTIEGREVEIPEHIPLCECETPEKVEKRSDKERSKWCANCGNPITGLRICNYTGTVNGFMYEGRFRNNG